VAISARCTFAGHAVRLGGCRASPSDGLSCSSGRYGSRRRTRFLSCRSRAPSRARHLPGALGSLWNGPPPPAEISLAGDSNGGADDENCSAWHRPRQECVQCCWSGPIRCCGPTSAGPEGYADRPGRKTAELHCRHEACLRRPSSWSPVRSSGARHSADVIGVCPSLCQGTEERRSWRRGNRRSGDAPNLRFVEMKTEDELDMQTLHRSRERQLAWLGLVPRQSTTGGKPRLMGISKRGNKYLRKLLIHGARAALPFVAGKDTALGRWAKSLLSRVHQNVAVVAFANKLARICWA
jgi:Transposase IS116/IS110/IS902 family